VETVLSYLANSINPDGLRAQEIIESLRATSNRSGATPAGSASGSWSSTASSV